MWESEKMKEVRDDKGQFMQFIMWTPLGGLWADKGLCCLP